MTENGCWVTYYASTPPCLNWIHRECLRDDEHPETSNGPDPAPGEFVCLRCGRTVD